MKNTKQVPDIPHLGPSPYPVHKIYTLNRYHRNQDHFSTHSIRSLYCVKLDHPSKLNILKNQKLKFRQ